MSILSILLYPFTVLYDLATRFRNYLFDIGYKKSFEFDRYVISVGNLSVGGTGKTPMVEYVINLLSKDYKLATLSRGYGRKTKGFKLATDQDDHLTIGDEPMQFYKKFENVTVAVGEERAVAIPFILAEKPETEVIILDDAYQHRYVKPNFNILLTSAKKPFYNDFVLPSGRLREARKGANRADAVIVTKCEKNISSIEMETIASEVHKYSNSPVYFSFIEYLEPVAIFDNNKWSDNVIVFSGIANSASLYNHISNRYNLVGQMEFGDHHSYTEKDISRLIKYYELCDVEGKCIVTTEKDMVRIQGEKIKKMFIDIPIFYIPIKTDFVTQGNNFNEILLKSIETQSH